VKKKRKLDLKPIEMDTPRANQMREMLKLAKTSPKIKEKYLKHAYPEGVEQTGTPIPVNVSLGEYEDQILPFIVTEYFIKKAGTILLMDCPCRRANKCENHDYHLGCTWMGEGVRHVDLSKWPVRNGRLATKEEALERERLAYENGLVPHLGKLRGDAVLYNVVDYEDQFMSICHCCSCCCVVSLMKYGPSEYKQVVKRMEGVEVRVDPDKCKGCGECFKVCIYDGLRMENDKAVINQENCMGCGRCEMTCQNKAVSISIDDYSRIDELIARFESRVDISG
jgi:NAD-dependent dihydropyrimidine dehydrogenase PreA subunit